LTPSCADCYAVWKPHPPGTVRAFKVCNGIAFPLPVHIQTYAIDLALEEQCGCAVSLNAYARLELGKVSKIQLDRICSNNYGTIDNLYWQKLRL
jgi:hypothetical protein